jgi:hypothetical protein
MMNMPQTIGEDVLMRRERTRLLAMTGGGPGGEEWQRNLGRTEHLFYRAQTTEDEPLRREQARMMRIYQATGQYDPDQKRESERGREWATVLNLLSMVDPRIEQERLSLVESGKLMEYGTSQQRTAAQQQVAQNPEIRRILTERLGDRLGLIGPLGERVAGASLDVMLKEDPETSLGLDPGDVTRAAADYATKDPRVQRMWEEQITHDGGEWRVFDVERTKRALLPYAAELSRDAVNYASRFVQLEQRAYDAERQGRDTFRWLYGPEEVTYEQGRERMRGMVANVDPTTRQDVERMARGWVRGPQAWPELGLAPEGFDQKEIGGFLPSRFRKTSFAGLAEAMQMGWSGAPPINVGGGAEGGGDTGRAVGMWGLLNNAPEWGLNAMGGPGGGLGGAMGESGIPALVPAASQLLDAGVTLKEAAQILKEGQAERALQEAEPTNLLFAPN